MTGFLFSIILTGTVGAIEYTSAVNARKALQKAADVAALTAGRAMRDDGASPVATDRAERIFESNCPDAICGVDPVVTLEFTGDTITATALSKNPVTLLPSVGLSEARLDATAQVKMAGNGVVDIHLLVDTSGSMNIPDGDAQIIDFTNLFQNPYSPNPHHKCSFACHTLPNDVPGSPVINFDIGLDIARANGIYLREDRVRDEAMAMVDDLFSAGSPRIAVSTFDIAVDGVTELTDDIDAIKTALSAIPGSSDGTYFNNVMAHLGTVTDPSSIDDGRQQVAIVITDGYDYPIGNTGDPSPIDPSVCEPVKAQGTDVFILNLEYPDTTLLEGDPGKVNYSESIRGDVYAALTACASPGHYFTAKDGDEIRDALAEIGAKAMGASSNIALTR